ncbi:hypothetical protein TSOC_003573 [Tetrabaena socialis]|uniref:Uncharacterized protein n=1 Tax=Tetrabaena socialis TaxID=47790 RepID=A0A2J8AB61_9CHLO|nr:hypothetical protein TSOC_003573 [Tetrabaena socialis]|eukprot:PNH09762.1 hypothetical protein TSOC_003573 [Tetrabaena socialis]
MPSAVSPVTPTSSSQTHSALVDHAAGIEQHPGMGMNSRCSSRTAPSSGPAPPPPPSSRPRAVTAAVLVATTGSRPGLGGDTRYRPVRQAGQRRQQLQAAVAASPQLLLRFLRIPSRPGRPCGAWSGGGGASSQARGSWYGACSTCSAMASSSSLLPLPGGPAASSSTPGRSATCRSISSRPVGTRSCCTRRKKQAPVSSKARMAASRGEPAPAKP